MKNLLVLFVRIYQVFSPSLAFLVRMFGVPYQCKFPISCSEYALQEIRTQQFLLIAVRNILNRLWHCSPWGSAVCHEDGFLVRSKDG